MTKRFNPARVLRGIPTTHTARMSMDWINAVSSLQMPLGSSMAQMTIMDEEIGIARSKLCDAAIDGGYEYLFFVSDDVLPPPNAILTMLDKIGREFPDEHGQLVKADMITGVYWTKTTPTEPYLWNGLLKGSYKDWTAGEFFPVDMAGCDCLLIDVKVLRAMREADPDMPIFTTDWAWEEGQKPSSIATEDFLFYARARKLGFRMFADTSIQCLHEDRSSGHMYGLTTDMPQAGGVAEMGDAELLIADIGAGTDSPYFGPNVKVVRFDGRTKVRPDVRCDILNIPDQYHGTFDVVHARHVLEHIGRATTLDALDGWAKLLKPGGQLIIRVPNVEHAMRTILDSGGRIGEDVKYAWDQVYGGQSYPLDFHKQGFTLRKLAAAVGAVTGIRDVIVERENDDQNLKATGTYHPVAVPVLRDIWESALDKEKNEREVEMPPVSDSLERVA